MSPLLAAVLLATSAQPPAGAAAGQPAPPPPPRASKSFPVEYLPPEDPAHQRIRDAARQQRVLEALSQYLGVLRMPRPLTLRLAGCKGEANAWYDNEEHSATFCYEFIADLVKNAPQAQEKGLGLDEAVLGPFTFFYLHEIGHAVFDMLKLPVLGREEDAADRFAAFVLLHAGEVIAVPTLRGTAWAFHHDAKARNPDESDFSDVHGLDAQRYYDVICLAYGSDPVAYQGATTKAGLPQDRAEACAAEWRMVDYSFRKVLAQYVDRKQLPQIRAQQVARAKARRTLAPAGTAPAAQPAAK